MPTTTDIPNSPAVAPPPACARFLTTRGLSAIAVFVVLGGLLAVPLLGERPPAWYPRCVFHEASGLHCPGCGTARAVHALGAGQFLRAIDQNALTVALLPLLVFWAGASAWRGLRHGLPPVMLPSGTAKIVLIVMLTFTVLRNLPWGPFALLAPE